MGATTRELEVQWLGLRPYQEVWDLQKKRQQACIAGDVPDCVIICEHEPCITVGRSASLQNVLFSAAELRRRGVALFEVERGGDVTYHGPGQVVLYPILNLTHYRRDVGWYLRTLEEIGRRALAQVGVEGLRYEGRTGIWTSVPDHVIESERTACRAKKIASIGVRLSRWCTMHGMALNVDDCRAGFSLVNPCGFTDIETTSVAQETGSSPGVQRMGELLMQEFAQSFRCDIDGDGDMRKMVERRVTNDRS